MKLHRENDVVSNACNVGAKDLEFIENSKNNLTLFFLLYLGYQIILASRRIGRFVLFSHKNNQEGWRESETFLEHGRTSTMGHFCENS